MTTVAVSKPTVITTTTVTPTTSVPKTQNLASDVTNDVSEKESRSIAKIVLIIFLILLLAAGVAIAIWLAVRAKNNNDKDIPKTVFLPIKLFTVPAGLGLNIVTATTSSSYQQYYSGQVAIPVGTVVQVFAQGPNGIITAAANDVPNNGGVSVFNYTVGGDSSGTSTARVATLNLFFPSSYRNSSGINNVLVNTATKTTNYPILVYYQ